MHRQSRYVFLSPPLRMSAGCRPACDAATAPSRPSCYLGGHLVFEGLDVEELLRVALRARAVGCECFAELPGEFRIFYDQRVFFELVQRKGLQVDRAH